MTVQLGSGYTADDFSRILYSKRAGTVTATSEASGFEAVLADAVDTASWWMPDTTSGTWTIAYASAQTVDAVGIAAHTLSGVLVVIQAEISSVWTTVASFTPSDNSAILALFTSVSCTGIRIVINDQQRIGVVYTGQALAMPSKTYVQSSPIDLNKQASLTSYVSEGGQLLARFVQRVGLKANYSWEHLTETWYRSTFEPFAIVAQTEPFFIAARPDGYPTDCAYAWVNGVIAPTRMGIRNLVSVSFEVMGHYGD